MEQEIVTADDLVRDLTKTKEPVFSRRNKTISGPLDLRHRTIHPAVDLQGCHFQDEVDLTYCTFEQTVDFTECTFDQGINSPSDLKSTRPFRCKGDFICDSAIFDGTLNIASARIEGSVSCDETVFNEPASFNGVRAERGATFHRAAFAKYADFITFHSEAQTNFKGATFEGPVDLNLLKSEGSAFFNGVTFDGDFDLSDATFDSGLEIAGATFNKNAGFGRLQCQSIDASFDKEYGVTTFKEMPTFDGLKCEDCGYFNGAQFEKGATFVDASFGSDLDFSWNDESGDVYFGGQVNLYALKCGGDAFFLGAQFQGGQEGDEARLTFSRIGGNLSFAACSFSYPLNLEQVSVSRELDLTADQFREISLYNATIEVLTLTSEAKGGPYTFQRKQASLDPRRLTFGRLLKRLRREKDVALQFDAALDLRGLTFNRFRGSKKDALEFARAQELTKFSLDPYVQIEDFYENVGMDVEARDVHYEGQLAMRRNAATRSSEVTWTFGRKFTDAFLRLLTGYGVRTSRVTLAIVFFLLLGSLVFSMGDLAPLGEALGVKTSAASASSAAAQNLSDPEPTAMDQISYSVDRFIPINMGVEESFEPRQPWSEVYALIHVFAGWLLIPLFLASWSGLVRSRR